MTENTPAEAETKAPAEAPKDETATKAAKPAKKGIKVGDVAETDNYTAIVEQGTSLVPQVHVRLRGGVGDVFVIPVQQLDEVKKLLGKL
jgi:hypothetical protein